MMFDVSASNIFADMLEIDGKMAPQDKMACLVKCSKNVFEMLKLSSDAPASADDFLPCLIYICLKANPPRIQSNINFITRFCNENKLRMGEGGYFFANLVSNHDSAWIVQHSLNCFQELQFHFLALFMA